MTLQFDNALETRALSATGQSMAAAKTIGDAEHILLQYAKVLPVAHTQAYLDTQPPITDTSAQFHNVLIYKDTLRPGKLQFRIFKDGRVFHPTSPTQTSRKLSKWLWTKPTEANFLAIKLQPQDWYQLHSWVDNATLKEFDLISNGLGIISPRILPKPVPLDFD